MASLYDVAVVGAGPAGSAAALHAARGGCRVLLLERGERAGTPVRCGEATGVAALADLVSVEPAWIGTRTTAARMVSPNGTAVTIDHIAEGYILRRDVMDARLVEIAREQGVQYVNQTPIVSVRREDGRFVCADPVGREFCARCLVIADGVESRLARQLGWNTVSAPHDISSCAFGRVAHPEVPEGVFEMHYGGIVAPGGYGWVFPRGDGSANVGLGVLGSRSSPGAALEYLRRFAARRFPGGQLTMVHSGGVPLARWVRPLARDGAMLVGDAARQVDALTGGGITYALTAGRLAGRAAAAAFAGGAFAPARLTAYEREWAKGPGRQLLRTYALKQMVIGLDDRTLDDIAGRLVRGPTSGMNLARICFAAFARRPLLLVKALMAYG